LRARGDMANDLGNPVQAKPASGDGFFDQATSADSLFGPVQLAQAGGTPGSTGGQPQTIHVNPPQGAAAGPVVIRVEVAPGSIVELPQPFEADAALLAKEGDGNLALRVGDVTIVLQGYVEANSEQPVVIEGADNRPIDIATVLAATDPAIDIQTAAGPADAGQNGQGADNSGAILAHLEDGNGLGGFESAGAQDGTELAYRTIDNSIRNDFADPLAAAGNVFGFSVAGFSGAFIEGFLRDPAQTNPFDDSQGSFFNTFLQEYEDAVTHPGQAMFAGWADFHGTAVTQGTDFAEYLDQTSKTATVGVTFTNGTGDLVLTGIGDGVTSNGSHLSVEIRDGGHTMFVRRDEATATDSGNALVAVIHVDGPDASGNFTIETILINRIDHHAAGNDTMDLDIRFTVYDGPAPNPEQEGQGTTSPSLDGHLTASFSDDVPILERVTYHNQHDSTGMAAREGVEAGGSDIGLIDEDWLRNGAHDRGADFSSNAGDDATGDTGGGTCVTGRIEVNFGADGAANWDGVTEQATQAEKHAFTLDTAQYVLGQAFPYGTDGLTSGGVTLVVLSVSGDHLTVGIADQKPSAQRVEGDASEQPSEPTDPIPGCAIFTLTLDQATGAFKFELKGPLDHGDSIFGDDTGVSALAEAKPEDTIPLQFGVTAMDDDGDQIHADIAIDVNDDMPVARNDLDHVAKGSHEEICGNVITGWGTDNHYTGKDSEGADHAQVVAVTAGDTTVDPGQEIQGKYGKLTIDAEGRYTYTRDAYTPGGVDDVFQYQLKDGDGDTSTANLTIHIDNAGVCIEVPAESAVHEAGLPDGSNANADSEFTQGTITIDAGDGIKSLTIGGETLDLAALKDLANHPKEISDDPKGKLTLTGFDEATGTLTYTYALEHNTNANTTSSTSFELKVTDTDDQEGSATLVIDIVDDEPVAVCDTIKIDAPKEPTADVQFILDISGSMRDQYVSIPNSADPSNTYPNNRIGLERLAVEKMLNAHPEIQNVQIVLFDDHASHSAWMTREQALAWIKDGDNFDGQGGDTNYDKALDEAMEGLVENRPLAQGDQTLVYFFSDGNPNEPRGGAGIDGNDGNGNVSEGHWTNFIDSHDVSNVFGVGIGSTNHLGPIAYPNGAAGSEPNLITLNGPGGGDMADLLGSLADAIVPAVNPVTGDLTANDTAGADGFGDAKLVSVTYDNVTLTFADNSATRHIDLGAGRGSIDIRGDGTYTYNPPAKNASGEPFTIEYKIQDGDGDIATAKLKIDINTRPETDLNGADCEGADGAASFVEDHGAIQIAPNGTVSDDDGQIAAMTVTLTDRPDGNSTEGLSLNAAALNAVAQTGGAVSWAYDPSTGKLTITGPADAATYQAILQGIQYNNSSDTPNTTPRHVTVVVNDGTFNGAVHGIDISVTPWNDAPTADISHDFAANEDQWIDLSGKIGNTLNMMIGDPDSGNDEVTVTISVTEGRLFVEDGWTGVQVTNNNSMSVTLKGTVAEINNLLKESNNGYVKYIDESGNPSSQVTLTLKVNDNGENGQGGAQIGEDSAIIHVTPVNDRPVTDLDADDSHDADNAVTFKEDYGAVRIAPDATVTDDGNIQSMTLTLSDIKDGAAESITLNAAGLLLAAGLTVTPYNPATGVLKITGDAPASVYQAILQNVVYENTSNTPNTGAQREVDVVVNDGLLDSQTHSVEITVRSNNDAPTATPLQSGLSVNEQASLNIAGKGLSIADVDAGGDTMTVKLTVGEGMLTVSKGGANVSVSGSGTGTVYISGAQWEINKLLTGATGAMTYKDDTNAPSPGTKLTMTVDDNGNNGNGGDETATVETTIVINGLNDDPTAHADTVYTNAGTTQIGIAEWMLLRNDSDPDSPVSNFDISDGDGNRLRGEPSQPQRVRRGRPRAVHRHQLQAQLGFEVRLHHDRRLGRLLDRPCHGSPGHQRRHAHGLGWRRHRHRASDHRHHRRCR
jgi:VCBS repeat-containing protein